ncbi:MAG TPA: RNA pseudouridine synthase [Sandaracinaceae bacterium LLY-WYZ-13_1]|nr:RNA pseudouridine synthase [Sandaracinaceae bacterium LLY-WYZ-13_1]
MSPSVLLDEDGVVVVDKPAGLESTGRTPDDPGGVQRHLADRLGRRIWAVHQLDRDTTGVLVFVRRKSLVAVWQRRLGRRSTRKRYLAVVHGRPRFRERVVTGALAYDRRARRWRVAPEGKSARTELRVRAAVDEAALVEAVLRTGRTHQARVHLAHEGHPLFGERRYRTPPCAAHPRHALHAWRLEVGPEPGFRGATFEAPVPGDLRGLLARLGLDDGLLPARG